jgi:hypothetical protein
MTIHLIIHRGNKYTIDIGGVQKIRHYPKRQIKNMLIGFCREFKPYMKNSDGDKIDVPIFLHDNNNQTTISFNTKKISGTGKKHITVPNSVRYVPNKLITFQDDNWQLSNIKRLFNKYDNGTIDEQKFKTEMRKVL